jgi:hypothetical protein
VKTAAKSGAATVAEFAGFAALAAFVACVAIGRLLGVRLAIGPPRR